jgi:DNA invertase Pin-like site-specific DNA recombinase
LALKHNWRPLKRSAIAEGYNFVQAFEEVETGKGAEALDRRPQLSAALKAAKQHKAPIIVAKLDRLSRGARYEQASIAIKTLGRSWPDNSHHRSDGLRFFA